MTTYHHEGYTITAERHTYRLVEYSVFRDSDGLVIAGGNDNDTIKNIFRYWREEIDELIATNGASMDLEEHFAPITVEATA